MSTPPNEQTDPEELRREIEVIRQELGETVAQIAYKADVKTQAREKAQEVKAQAREKAQGVKVNVQEVKANALRRAPDSAQGGMQQVAGRAQHVVTGARRHPLPLAAAGALVLAFLVGRRVGLRSA
jgi:ribosome-binding ATPase YchF (GTP1/OBG family)